MLDRGGARKPLEGKNTDVLTARVGPSRARRGARARSQGREVRVNGFDQRTSETPRKGCLARRASGELRPSSRGLRRSLPRGAPPRYGRSLLGRGARAVFSAPPLSRSALAALRAARSIAFPFA